MIFQITLAASALAVAQAAVVPRAGYGEINYKNQNGNCLETVMTRSGPSVGYESRTCPGACPWDSLKSKYGDRLAWQQDGSATLPMGGTFDYTCSEQPSNDFRCIQSCKDGGNWVRMVTTSDGKLGCKGDASNRCTWYTDSQCQIKAQNAQDPTMIATDILCPVGRTSGSHLTAWCEEAIRVMWEDQTPQQCNVNPPTPSTCPNAPQGGYPYGGKTGFRCLQDSNNPDSYTPVKVTTWSEVACMSHDSVNCLWASKECCDNLVATSDAKTPFLECGHRHQALYGITGYENPNHWCAQGKALLDR